MLPKQKNKNDSIDLVVIDDLADPNQQNQIKITIENKENKQQTISIKEEDENEENANFNEVSMVSKQSSFGLKQATQKLNDTPLS